MSECEQSTSNQFRGDELNTRVGTIAMPPKESEGDKSAPFRRCRWGSCSFCRRNYRDVGPMVEGPDLVFICFKCIEGSTQLLEDEYRHLGKALPSTSKAGGEKGKDQGGSEGELSFCLENPATACSQSLVGKPEIEKSLARTVAATPKESDGDEDGPLRRCYPGRCSFCRRNYRDVGPLVEGADFVYTCYDCLKLCAQLIDDACRSTGKALPWTCKELKEKGPDEGGV